MRVNRSRRKWRFPRWWISLLTLLSLTLLIKLGFWQLHRADEKQGMLTQYTRLNSMKPLHLGKDIEQPEQYRSVYVTGHFLPHVFLFDNQHREHRFGYNVLSPFLLESNQVVFIDRGWVPGDITRQRFPQVETPNIMVSFSGRVYYPSSKSWVLGDVIEQKNPHLTVIERIDPDMLSKILHKTVYPFIIRLGKNEPYGFVREWPVIAMSPDRHRAYALQWFSMATILAILFIALNFEKEQ